VKSTPSSWAREPAIAPAVILSALLPPTVHWSGLVRGGPPEKFIKSVFPNEEYDAAEKRFMKEDRPTSLIARLIRPEELAAAVTFLCSPIGSAINGESTKVDGGMIRSAV
jgi:NAD(P)-dependent dehydrogenase (short-subunit alcohol dehydrogenase family)